MPDDLPELAAQRARRKARSNPEALARKIESVWRADPAAAGPELAEERAIRDGVSADQHRAADRLERERIIANLRNPHGRTRDGHHWRPCSCDRRNRSSCPVLEAIPLARAGTEARAAAFAARDWLEPPAWAEAAGLRRVAREESDAAEAWAHERILSGMAYAFEIHGDALWQNSVVQARLRELYAHRLYDLHKTRY